MRNSSLDNFFRNFITVNYGGKQTRRGEAYQCEDSHSDKNFDKRKAALHLHYSVGFATNVVTEVTVLP